MQLSDILHNKGATVHACSPSDSLADAVDLLVGHNIGSLVVLERGEMVGIITERDILRACAGGKTPLNRFPVSSSMTANPFTARLSDTIEDAMDLITEKRIRHLPIVENDELVGLVSIGDLVKARQHLAEVENHYLKSYIHG